MHEAPPSGSGGPKQPLKLRTVQRKKQHVSSYDRGIHEYQIED